MASRPHCAHCGTALASGASYCSECGTAQTLIVLDPLGVENPPVLRGTDLVPHARLRMLAALVLVLAMLAVLWDMGRDASPADTEPLSSETPEVGVRGTDTATSTTVATTTASSTTGVPSPSSEQRFVNDVQAPVLGDDVAGVLVQLVGRTMRQIDLSNGAIEHIDLEHPVYRASSDRGIVVNGNLVSLSGNVITTTDLSDGSQREPRGITDGSFAADPALSDDEEGRVVGPADVDSVWLAGYPKQGQSSEAIEVDFDGEVKRRVEIAQPFEIDWADGNELILGSPDGSWRYDTATGATLRMPGAVVAFEPGLVITASCNASLQCHVLIDRGSGAEPVDWPNAGELFKSSIDVSPDLSGALVHVSGETETEFTFIDLITGSSVDLGHLPIDPDSGVIWVEGSSWIIDRDDASLRTFLAIDTETGTQVDLVLPSGIGSESFIAFIPSSRGSGASD